MIRPLQGLVLHIEQGTEDGTFGWFNTSKAERQAAFERFMKARLSDFVQNTQSQADNDQIEMYWDAGGSRFVATGLQSCGLSGCLSNTFATEAAVDNALPALGEGLLHEDMTALRHRVFSQALRLGF